MEWLAQRQGWMDEEPLPLFPLLASGGSESAEQLKGGAFPPASGPVHNGDEECFSVALHLGLEARILG